GGGSGPTDNPPGNHAGGSASGNNPNAGDSHGTGNSGSAANGKGLTGVPLAFIVPTSSSPGSPDGVLELVDAGNPGARPIVVDRQRDADSGIYTPVTIVDTYEFDTATGAKINREPSLL